MRTAFEQFPVLLALLMAAPTVAAGADWQAQEVEKTYSINGTTGPELYASIGDKGPLIRDTTRTIAFTTFTLKWSRKYEPEGTTCRLVSARPFLTVIYTLPKATGKLDGAMRDRWQTFIDGIRRHERVHGDHMKEMVDTILRTTIGMTVEDDPQCKKIRKEIEKPLLEASQTQKRKSRDFDGEEMRDGGNVHRLILDLVNGG